MDKQVRLWIVSLTIFLFASVALYSLLSVPKSQMQHDFSLDAYTSVKVLRADGSVENVQTADHNFFSNAGKDLVLDLLAGRVAPAGTAAASSNILSNVTQIAVGNDSGATGLIQTYFDSGLTNATGTVTRITNGNWSVVVTFTSTANNKDVNATALFNGTNAGATYFAGNNFTKVTLQNNDQLQITWNVSVS